MGPKTKFGLRGVYNNKSYTAIWHHKASVKWRGCSELNIEVTAVIRRSDPCIVLSVHGPVVDGFSLHCQDNLWMSRLRHHAARGQHFHLSVLIQPAYLLPKKWYSKLKVFCPKLHRTMAESESLQQYAFLWRNSLWYSRVESNTNFINLVDFYSAIKQFIYSLIHNNSRLYCIGMWEEEWWAMSLEWSEQLG